MRAATVFALSAGLTLPALATAPAAYAIDMTRTVTYDDGRLAVDLPSQALWAKVSVLASTAPDAAVLASSDDLRFESGDWATERISGWVTSEALKLPEGTALGDYPVVVEYRMPSGATQTWTGGTYSYKLHTGVDKLAFDRKTTDYENRKVILSGTATAWDPSTGARTPARAGTKIQVTVNVHDLDYKLRLGRLTATTGADGTFSMSYIPDGEISGGKATVVDPAADTDPDVGRPLPTVGIEKLTYRISAGQNKYRVAKNTDVTMSGTVQRLTQDGWKPFAYAPVVTANTYPRGDLAVPGQMGSGTTAADGTFKYGARATYATQTYTYLRPSPYFEDIPYDQGEIAVPQPLTYSVLKMSMDQYGEVHATAHLNGGDCANEPYQLQVSFDGGHNWQWLKSGKAQYGNGYSYCKVDIKTWGYVSATYRLHHYETDRYAPKDSSAVKLSRIDTRFSAFSITPSRPRVNSKMTVTGTLQKNTGGTWKALSGAKVTLVFRPKGDSTWYWVTRDVPTNSYGKFSFKATNYGDGTWGVYKQEQAGYFYSQSKDKYIDAI
ncbi:hypothetical protein AB0C52_04930 [Streptomyces sp. NPDC048717]|uniref:hypothetical protein n=1 Tax=Streptomyces sp. NPDC048717 TaxID=3154928 RepID=UPI00341C28BB